MKPISPESARFPSCPYAGMQDGKSGWFFQRYAPEAASVSVAGDFNQWQPDAAFLTDSGGGWWTGFVPQAQKGDLYQYVCHTVAGDQAYRSDPCAIAVEPLPGSACRLWDFSDCRWQDENWFAFRETSAPSPELLYHIDLTTERPAEAAAHWIPRLKQLCCTGAAFSIGLGTSTSFFAPCAGWLPEELTGLIDQFHRAGLSVFLDWNPTRVSDVFSVLPPSAHCDSVRLDWTCPEIRRFLVGSALFWAQCYHLDGLRILANVPDRYLPGRGSTAFLTSLQQTLAQQAPHCQLVLRSPMPLEQFSGQAERSAQPLVDLFLHRAVTPDQSLIEGGLLTFDWANGDLIARCACYLTFLALPGGKLILQDAAVLPEAFLQRAHHFYLEEPLLWPHSPFRWAVPPTEYAPLVAFWRGYAGTRQLLCLCNPTEQHLPLTLPNGSDGQFHLLLSSQDSLPVPIISEQTGSAALFSLPPLSCTLFDYLPSASLAGFSGTDTMGRI